MGRERIALRLRTAEEMGVWAASLAPRLAPGAVWALEGDLGAGKTTFVQGLLRGMGIVEGVQSPTFTYCQVYEGMCPVYHFDLYRLKSAQEFVQMGFEEYLGADGIALIEWPDRIEPLLPPATTRVRFRYAADGGREVEII